MTAALWLLLATLPALALATPADDITPRAFPIPAPTEWRPVGCRTVPFTHPVLLPRTAFRRAHGDLDSSDEVALAYAPVFERTWVAEPSLYQVTTPTFDSAGNLYMTPLLPHESILLLSLEPASGARRFVIPLQDGDRAGGVTPMVLRDPETGGEVIYVNAYDRVIAVRTDGSLVWDAPTGLGAATTADQSPVGLAWVPNADAIVGLTRDGWVFLLARRTGAPLLAAPYQLPGDRTPAAPSTIPANVMSAAGALLEPMISFSSPGGLNDLIAVLLGGNSEVANNLSVDGRTGRLWIAATARDEEDGLVDGVSELGAVYRIDVVPGGGGWALSEACHRTFTGGSASTPTLGQEGARVYLGDNVGALIAIDADTCNEAWSVPLASQIFGSVAAASDGHEIYAASGSGVYQVFDDGAVGRRGWTAALDVYDIPASLTGYGGQNLLLTGAGANGLLMQVGAGLTSGGRALPVRTGIAHLDRLTGQVRGFADGLEESLGAMSTGPDGALYLPQAPLRRAFSLALGLTSEPLLGGVSKWASTRDDLLARDAACAAADRADRARQEAGDCLDSAIADASQVDALGTQTLDAAMHAAGRGQLAARDHRRLQRLAAKARRLPDLANAKTISRYHRRAGRVFGRACRLLTTIGGE